MLSEAPRSRSIWPWTVHSTCSRPDLDALFEAMDEGHQRFSGGDLGMVLAGRRDTPTEKNTYFP
jgi:hypothetical protein